MDKSKKNKVKKVIKGLKKASKLHAGQAKVLKKVIKKGQNMSHDKVDTRTQRQILSKKSKAGNPKKIKTKNDFRTGNALISESEKRKVFKKMKKGGRA